jgi:glycosyltransferase involved in cell wall biosynthesis
LVPSGSTGGALELISLIPGCGYGDAAVQYAAGLQRQGCPVRWLPLRSDSPRLLARQVALADVPDAEQTLMAGLWKRSLRPGPEALLLHVPPWRWHDYWAEKRPGLRLYTYVAWEVGQLPEEWVSPLSRYQRVFVPSRFNQKALREGGIEVPVEVVPHIAREPRPGGTRLSFGSVRDDDFLFYTVGTWTARKAMERTVRAFLDAFTADDPVGLVIKSEYFNQVELQSPERDRNTPDIILTVAWTLAQIIAQYPNPARIHLLPMRLEPAQMDQLHQRGGCYISLAYSEGWGLGAFEAALNGNPVVITGWGGQLDYLGEDYPWLVKYQKTSTALVRGDGNFHQRADTYWATADSGHASQLMVEVFTRRVDARQWAAAFAPGLARRYHAQRVSQQLARAMELRHDAA